MCNTVIFQLLIIFLLTTLIQCSKKDDQKMKEAEQLQQWAKTHVGPTAQWAVRKQTVNKQNEGKPFGGSDEFSFKVNRSGITNQTLIETLKSLDAWNKLQPNSKYDYLNITNKINFTQYSQKLFNSLSYQLFTFPSKKKTVYKKKINVDMRKSATYSGLYSWVYGSKRRSVEYEYWLYKRLVKDPDNIKNNEEAYIFNDFKHDIGKFRKETPMCVFSMGYRLFAKNRYIQYFSSLERMNYTNFRVIYVDDYSPQQQILGLVKYIYQKNYHYKNNLTIVHNLMRVSALGNIYYWTNKLCNQDDIVLFMDGDDYFITPQALQILNTKYQDPSIWVVYSKFILNPLKTNIFKSGGSKALSVPPDRYRNTLIWQVHHLKTLRKSLFAKMPIDLFIQFHVNETQQKAYPIFYQSSSDAFIIFPFIQLCQRQRIMFITDYLYLYTGSSKSSYGCYTERQNYEGFKVRIKTALKPLKSLNDTASLVLNYSVNPQMIKRMQYTNRVYKKCLGIPYP